MARLDCAIQPRALTMDAYRLSEIDAMGASTSDPVQELRQEVHALAERLSPDATWGDVLEYARYRLAVQEGMAAARRGEFASDEEVSRLYLKLGIES